ncbi:LuxR family two component transcriptional regulator [Winogradskyella pacifica]|uniref:LuxR family two component transcriptional regulator n=1 Tax=Winogradskyella pacifica TaxID=664642 RepID=A0A3D9N3V1_9FLAO|nr:response regulator transcription factor [Winogradskyella pacifica]REE24751.1 LuxR family two component transcriptional regulator [Winogradskyella pacifica]
MITVAIAEDHQSFIDGIKLLLEYEEDITIVGTANDGEALLDLVRLKQPSVVITDIRMPKMDGITAAKKIKKELPQTKILGFTMFDQKDAVKQMLDAGASGYLLKNSPLEEVLKAIRAVYNGNTYFDANIEIEAKNDTNKSAKSILTKRQVEILNLVAQGKTSREIADELFIGIHTVETHRKNMIRILGLQGKGELMRYALEKKYKF